MDNILTKSPSPIFILLFSHVFFENKIVCSPLAIELPPSLTILFYFDGILLHYITKIL